MEFLVANQGMQVQWNLGAFTSPQLILPLTEHIFCRYIKGKTIALEGNTKNPTFWDSTIISRLANSRKREPREKETTQTANQLGSSLAKIDEELVEKQIREVKQVEKNQNSKVPGKEPKGSKSRRL